MVFLPRVHLVMAEITNEAEFVLQIMELKVWCGVFWVRKGTKWKANRHGNSDLPIVSQTGGGKKWQHVEP